jgi:hypothetical protein
MALNKDIYNAVYEMFYKKVLKAGYNRKDFFVDSIVKASAPMQGNYRVNYTRMGGAENNTHCIYIPASEVPKQTKYKSIW